MSPGSVQSTAETAGLAFSAGWAAATEPEHMNNRAPIAAIICELRRHTIIFRRRSDDFAHGLSCRLREVSMFAMGQHSVQPSLRPSVLGIGGIQVPGGKIGRAHV